MGKKNKFKEQPRGGPGPSLVKLATKLFGETDETQEFVRSLSDPKTNPARETQSAIVITDRQITEVPFEAEKPSAWMPSWAVRLSPGQKAGSSALHEAGKIYCLDLSSVFEGSVLQEVRTNNPLCLDMCASPGGKSVLTFRTLQPRMIISNEVIGKRTAPLISNLKRCGVKPALVTALDPSKFKELTPQAFDLVIVDAPCSGQSLLARGKHSPGCFHPATIRMNAGRQKRILGCAADAVASKGYIAYMTCTFSREENEDVIEWFLERHPEFETVEVPGLLDYRTHVADLNCYRMWPHRGEGSGGFTTLLRRNDEFIEGGERGVAEKLEEIAVASIR